MTYYKYAERDATSQVNWADVSKNFSDEIIRVGKEREKKRDAIDTATKDLVTKINEAPTGQHANANLFTATLVDQTTEDTLRMNKLLKSGEIRPSEYMNYIENQKASVTGLYDMVTGYQDVYANKMERMRNNDSLAFEWEGMAEVEGFGNFATTTPVIDMYGNITMVDNNTGKTLTTAQMNAVTKQYFNAYDIDGAMEKQKEQLGQYLTVEMRGNTRTIDDVRRQDGFTQYMDDLVSETLAGPLATSTILLQDLTGYSTSFSPGKDPEKVLVSIDDPRQPGSGAQVPLVEVIEQVEDMDENELRKLFAEGEDVNAIIANAKAQRKAAQEWARKDLNYRLDRIETPMAEPRKPSSEEIKQQKGAERTVGVVTNIRKLHSLKEGESQEDVDAAVSYIQQLNPNVRKIDLRDEEIVIRMKDGDLIPIPKGDKADLFVESIINAVYKDKAVNLSDALKRAGVYDEGLTRHTLGSVAGIDETLDFDEVKDDLIITDETTGETGSGSPKSLFIATTSSNEDADSIVPKQTTVMQQMGIEDAEVGYETMTTGFIGGDSNALRLNIPSMFPQAILISEEVDLQQVLLNLNQLISENRGTRLTEEQLKAVIPSYEAFNNQKQRERFGIESNTETKLSWTNWSKQNPGGTTAEYLEYFNS